MTVATPFSVLDLAPILAGGDAAQTFRNSLDLARHAERWGYRRYWLAEHHSMTGIGSAATSVLIGYVAGGTSSIRVGSGGVMLPNHAPLVIAEQFGTLASLYPGRIDLGVGRAPGTGPEASRALRRTLTVAEDDFPKDVVELQIFLSAAEPGQVVRAVPGAGLAVPIWLLGSSLYSAHVAAALGLPFAFASHFAPGQLMPALEAYRTNFRPSEALEQPFAMVAVNVIAAETDAEARLLFSSLQMQFLELRSTGDAPPLRPPVEDFEARISPAGRQLLEDSLAYSLVGSPETVRRKLAEVIDRTAADEIIIGGQIYDHAARLRSFEIAAEVREALAERSDAGSSRIERLLG